MEIGKYETENNLEMGKLLGQQPYDQRHELGRLEPKRFRPQPERPDVGHPTPDQSAGINHTQQAAPTRQIKRGPTPADIEFIRKSGRYDNKIGTYLRKLAPLQSHPSAAIKQKAKSLRRQFISKQRQLKSQMSNRMTR